MRKIILVAFLFISASDIKAQISMLPSGGKLLSITTNDGYVTVSRFNLDGTADMPFGTGGTTTTYVSPFDLSLFSYSVGEGKIAVFYYMKSPFNFDMAYVLLFNSDGTLDTLFGINGIVTINLNFGHGNDTPVGLSIENGEVIVSIRRFRFGPTGGIGLDIKHYPFTTCPQNISINTDAGQCGAIVNYTVPGFTQVAGYPSGSVFPVGTTTNTFTVTQGTQTFTCSFTVNVEDKESPVISNVSATPSILWPPNNKMQDVEIKYNLSDNCGNVTAVLTVTPGIANDDIANDWQVTDAHHVRLRAARSGRSGRIYVITITATDQSGNKSEQQVNVIVPHDNSNKRLITGTGYSEPQLGGKLVKELTVNVLSNPSKDHFTLEARSNSNSPLSVKVADAVGRIVETRTGLFANGSIQLGNKYRNGIYFAEVTQGTKRVTLKLIKSL